MQWNIPDITRWEWALLPLQRMSVSPSEHLQRRSLCAASKMVSYSAQHITCQHGCASTAWRKKQPAPLTCGVHAVPAQQTNAVSKTDAARSQLGFPACWLPQKDKPQTAAVLTCRSQQQNSECNTGSLWRSLDRFVVPNVLPSVYWQAQLGGIISSLRKSLKMHVSMVKEGKQGVWGKYFYHTA